MGNDLEDLPYYDEEEVIASSSKFHRLSCPAIRNILRRNLKKFRSWQNAVDQGYEPCGVCRPFHKPILEALAPERITSAPLSQVVSTTQLAEWRREIVKLLSALEQGRARPHDEGVGAWITRLFRAGAIPREIAAVMRTITEMRNAAEYQSKVLSRAESALVAAAHATIQEWADTKGLDTVL
jgi:methylphosphotriester-DNA--protein-cysteine methyltransferase